MLFVEQGAFYSTTIEGFIQLYQLFGLCKPVVFLIRGDTCSRYAAPVFTTNGVRGTVVFLDRLEIPSKLVDRQWGVTHKGHLGIRATDKQTLTRALRAVGVSKEDLKPLLAVTAKTWKTVLDETDVEDGAESKVTVTRGSSPPTEYTFAAPNAPHGATHVEVKILYDRGYLEYTASIDTTAAYAAHQAVIQKALTDHGISVIEGVSHANASY